MWAIETEGFEDKDNAKSQIRVGDHGFANPHVATGDEGQFRFEIQYDNSILNNLPTKIFFLAGDSLVSNENTRQPLLLREGEPLAVPIELDMDHVNIGEVQLSGR